MKKIGFIGYGSMGKVILEGFLLSGIIKPYEVIISNRTISKLDNLKNEYPDIEIADNNIVTSNEF